MSSNSNNSRWLVLYAIATALGCTTILTTLVAPLPLVALTDAQRFVALESSLNSYGGLPASLGIKASYNPGGPQAPNPLWRPASTTQGPDLPAHCIVSGVIDKRTGTDNKPYETRFELRLPQTWTGRLLYQGGGGIDGIVNSATGRNTGNLGDYG
jgi:hypothetical protein